MTLVKIPIYANNSYIFQQKVSIIYNMHDFIYNIAQ